MITFREFAEVFTDVQKNAMSTYMDDHGMSPYPCEILHRDFQIEETPSPNAEQTVHHIAAVLGIPVENVDTNAHAIKLTEEHEQIHQLLQNVKYDAMRGGLQAEQMIAAALVIGRRMGLREAAQVMMADIPDNLDSGERP